MNKFDFAWESEIMFADYMRGHGYRAERLGGFSKCADVVVTNPRNEKTITVEVKASRVTNHSRRLVTRSYQHGFQFLLYKVNRSVRINDDFVALRCANGSDTWFVIPLEFCATLNNITITRADPHDYAGKWSAFRGRFDLLYAALN